MKSPDKNDGENLKDLYAEKFGSFSSNFVSKFPEGVPISHLYKLTGFSWNLGTLRLKGALTENYQEVFTKWFSAWEIPWIEEMTEYRVNQYPELTKLIKNFNLLDMGNGLILEVRFFSPLFEDKITTPLQLREAMEELIEKEKQKLETDFLHTLEQESLLEELEEAEGYYQGEILRDPLIIRLKKPFVDWVRYIKENLTKRQTDLLKIPSVYMVEITDWTPEKMDELFGMYYELIFEIELRKWESDESIWPQNRSLEMFHEWFDFELGEQVYDLLDQPIGKLMDPDTFAEDDIFSGDDFDEEDFDEEGEQ